MATTSRFAVMLADAESALRTSYSASHGDTAAFSVAYSVAYAQAQALVAIAFVLGEISDTLIRMDEREV